MGKNSNAVDDDEQTNLDGLLSKKKYCLHPILYCKCKKYFTILKKKFARSKLKALLCLTYLLCSEFQTIQML